MSYRLQKQKQKQQQEQQVVDCKENDNKKKNNLKKARSLLREPSEEEEKLTVGSNRLLLRGTSNTCSGSNSNNTNVISSASDPSESMNGRLGRSKYNNLNNSSNNSMSKNGRRNSNLSSLLSILFGSFLVLLSLLSVSAALTDNRSTLAPKFADSISSSLRSIDLPTTTTTAATTTELSVEFTTNQPVASSGGEESRTKTTLEDDENSSVTEGDDELELPAPTSGSPRAAIVDVGGNVADMLVERLGRREEPSTDVSAEDESGDVGKEVDLELQSEKKEKALNSTEEQLKIAMETYERWKATGDDLIELFSRKMLPLVIEHGYEVDAGTVGGLLQVFNGIRALKPWALKILDASAKITPSLLLGTQADFGDFDECLNVRSDDPSGLATPEALSAEPDPATGLRPTTLVGRYCIADVEFPKPPRIPLPEGSIDPERGAAGYFAPIELRKPLLNFSETAAFKETIFVETANFFHMLYVDPIRVGLCLTNKIDPEHFAALLNKLVEHFRVRINFHGRCVTKYDKIEWTIQQKVSAWVLVVACSLVALSTILDILHNKLGKLPLPEALNKWQAQTKIALAPHRSLFTSFSLIRNTKRLFNAPQPARPSIKELEQQHLPTPESLSSARTSIEGSSSESESSPSIERRSSLASSALHLIECSSANQISSASNLMNQRKLNELTLQFQQVRASSVTNSKHNDQANLLCLHGIRVITMTWMIVNHTYLFGGFFVLWAYRRLIDIAEWPKSISFQLVLNGWLTVETYFFLSALIIVLNVMPLMKARKFTYFSYIIHRLVRLLPAYVGLVSLNFLWPLISSGPVWLVKGKSFIQTPCENYLWTNFLFINNWIWPEKQCMVHTWFLSADFQLYLLAPIFVFLLSRRPVFGHSVNILVAVVASVFSGFIIYANKLMPSTLINKLEFDSIKQQLSYSYFATYQHMGPYCLGIFIGYLLHKRPQVHLPKHLTWLLWILLPPLSFTTLLLTFLWNGAYAEPNLINPTPLVSALYVAIHRTIWTSLLAWIVFACTTGRAKLMSDFLSHSIFIPLSRLSFSIYLVHLPVIMFRALNLRHTIEWTDTNILWEACGNFVVSVIVGYFVNISFESPFTNLEHVFFKRSTDDKEQKVGAKQNFNHIQSNLSSSAITDTGSKLAAINILQPRMGISGVRNSESTDDSDTDNKQTSQVNLVEKPDNRKSSSSAVTGGIVNNDPQELGWSSRKELGQFDLRNPLCSYDDGTSGSQMEPQSLSDEEEHTTESATFDMNSVQTGAQKQRQMAATMSNLSHYPNSHHKVQAKKIKLDNLDQKNAPTPRYSSSNFSRPANYVTLARTSRFNHPELQTNLESSESGHLFKHQSPAKARGHYLDRPISRLANQESSSSSSSSYLDKQRIHLLNRRQGRYNTLTGTGAREWGQHYRSIQQRSIDNSSRLVTGYDQRTQEIEGPPVGNIDLISNWLAQPAGPIPRIDSSTLRRFKRSETIGSSIVEEPFVVEHSDL